MLFLNKYESNLIVHGFCSPSHYNGVERGGKRSLNMKICQNFLVTKFLLTFMTDMGGYKNKWGSNIYYYITTLSLSHFFRNNQPPEKSSVSFENFFRHSQSISCYFPIS